MWDILTKFPIHPSLARLSLLHLNFLFLASIIQLAVWLAVFGCGLMAVNLRQIGSDICAVWNHRWRVVVRLGSLFKHRLQPLPQIVRFQFVKSRQILTEERELLQIPMPDGAHHVQTVKDWIRTNWKIDNYLIDWNLSQVQEFRGLATILCVCLRRSKSTMQSEW